MLPIYYSLVAKLFMYDDLNLVTALLQHSKTVFLVVVSGHMQKTTTFYELFTNFFVFLQFYYAKSHFNLSVHITWSNFRIACFKHFWCLLDSFHPKPRFVWQLVRQLVHTFSDNDKNLILFQVSEHLVH